MSTRTLRVVAIAIGILGLVFAVWGIRSVYAADQKERRDEIAEIRRDAAEDRADAKALAEQVRDLGGKPIAQPDAPNTRLVPVPGKPGKDAKPGKPGADGEDAPPPTLAQLAEAVAAYCAARNECKPPAPADGKDAPRVAAITCSGMNPPETFTFRFSDGSEIVAECEMLPPVEP